MKALIEPVAAVLRVVSDDAGHGDPYSFSTTVRWLDPWTIELCGAIRAPTPPEARAIVAALRQQGAATILIRRYRDGRQRVVRLKLGSRDDR